jgi:hypothetical protein
MITWILVAYGLTTLITQSSIMAPLRNKAMTIHDKLGELFHCPMCFGFWSGIILSFAWESPTGNFILDGLLALGGNWLLYCLTWWLALKDSNV